MNKDVHALSMIIGNIDDLLRKFGSKDHVLRGLGVAVWADILINTSERAQDLIHEGIVEFGEDRLYDYLVHDQMSDYWASLKTILMSVQRKMVQKN